MIHGSVGYTNITTGVVYTPVTYVTDISLSWQWHGFGFFTLTKREENRPLGRVGLLKHSNWPEIELARHLFEGSEGKGYATKAAKAVRSWAYQTHGCTQLVSYIDCTNLRSL